MLNTLLAAREICRFAVHMLADAVNTLYRSRNAKTWAIGQ